MPLDCDENMIEGKGKNINRPTKTGKKHYDRFFIYVPVEVARDSSYPFANGEEVLIKIEVPKKRLIIEKIKK